MLVTSLPDVSNLKNIKNEASTKIYDRNGTLLYTVYKDTNRTPLHLSNIPKSVQLATIAAEDAEFYSHTGYSVKGVLRSIYKYLQKGELTGGSTITQQLVKNILLTPEKTLTRKLKEFVLALKVEKKYTKDEILEIYLNEVSYGGAARGIEAASEMYFEKSVDKLSLPEAALLAGIPKSPTKLSPFGTNPELTKKRQEEVLDLMASHGFVSENDAADAKRAKITFAKDKTEIKAPHFVMYIKELLSSMYGDEFLETGGLSVKTSLDLPVQELAQKVVSEEVNHIRKLNVTNGAAVILNPQNGEILAMVGSIDYFNQKIDGNVNVTLRLRQPGSSIKVVNYAYALSHGYTPASILMDVPTTFTVPGSRPYTPKDYDGTYRGPITLRSALAESRNIPAVAVLNSYGVKNMVEEGQKLGITSWDGSSYYGLSLTLGAADVTLLDLARVYATIANYGKRPNITPILEIKDNKGKVIFKPCDLQKIKFLGENCGPQELDPKVAFQLTDILRDNNARSPAFGRYSSLVVSGHPEVAVKTGTSNDLRDNLTIGYTKDYLVATWVGNNDNTPMSRVASGVTGASPIWNKIITALLLNSTPTNWEVPQGLVNKTTCQGTNEWFIAGTEPNGSCAAVASKEKGVKKLN